MKLKEMEEWILPIPRTILDNPLGFEIWLILLPGLNAQMGSHQVIWYPQTELARSKCDF